MLSLIRIALNPNHFVSGLIFSLCCLLLKLICFIIPVRLTIGLSIMRNNSIWKQYNFQLGGYLSRINRVYLNIGFDSNEWDYGFHILNLIFHDVQDKNDIVLSGDSTRMRHGMRNGIIIPII